MKFRIFLLLSVFSSFTFSKEVVDKIAASVNNEIVLLSELKSMEARLKKVGSIEESLLLGASPDSLKGNKKAQLDFLIREKLVDSEIKRLSMSLTEEQVNAELAQMAKRGRMTMAEFTSYMAGQGYTLEQYKEVLKAQNERRAFFEKEIVSKLRITDEDAYGVFQTKFPNYRPSVGEFKIAQIFFSVKKGGPDSALERAKAALEKINGGESFETVANLVDETPGSNKDGVLGSFKSGEFLPEIENALGGLSVGSISGILRGPNGYHIVKLLDKKSVVDPNFIKVKEQIKASLIQQNFERQLKNWFELKKLDANIKIYNEVL
ncbi:peptidylprolyl isomerase [bacterium]|nr:peptidylprolyl isomerase [bacterium]